MEVQSEGHHEVSQEASEGIPLSTESPLLPSIFSTSLYSNQIGDLNGNKSLHEKEGSNYSHDYSDGMNGISIEEALQLIEMYFAVLQILLII
jgi:hypothetical protein